MDWKLFWNVVRIAFGVVFSIAALVMMFFSLFAGNGIDMAYCLFAVVTLVLGLIMVTFGYAALPVKE